MDYIVRTFGIGCDDPKVRWHVTGDGVSPFDVLARSADEAIYKVQFATGDNYNTAEVVGEIKVVVTRPDGVVDFIGCICMDEAKKYVRRYSARGLSAYIQIITTDCAMPLMDVRML